VQGDIKSTQIVGSEPDAHMFILDKMAALWDRQLGPLEQRQRDLEQQVRRLKEELRKSQVRERAEKEALARERADHAAMAALQTEKLATSETALIEAVAKQKGTTLERDLLQSRVAELERANQSLVEASRKISEENRNLVAYRAAVLEATLSSTRHTGATAAADSAIQVAHDPQNPSDRTYCAVSQG
jgi:chromosome segregation ATPase